VEAIVRLNLAVLAFSLAMSAVLALHTATFRNNSVRTAMIVVVIVGTLFGVYLLIAWLRNRELQTQTCDVIRKETIEPEIVVKETSVTQLVPTEPSKPKQ